MSRGPGIWMNKGSVRGEGAATPNPNRDIELNCICVGFVASLRAILISAPGSLTKGSRIRSDRAPSVPREMEGLSK